MESDKFYFFWGTKTSYFSQWRFIDMFVDDIKYNCCEQYMMAEKARMFKDEEILNLIMKSKDPREQKKLGRKVKGFNKEAWGNNARDIVYKGNYAKFTQNEECLKELYETGEKELVEASPFDEVWGIKLSADDPRALDKEQWLGTNWLGEVLMKVRKQMEIEKRFDKYNGSVM